VSRQEKDGTLHYATASLAIPGANQCFALIRTMLRARQQLKRLDEICQW